MALSGHGLYCVVVLWALSALVFLFVLLRLYTRLVCVTGYGMDDSFYLLTWVLIVAYSSLITIAAYHGYGQENLDAATLVSATYYLAALFTWLDCIPLAYAYDASIPGGHCVNTVPPAVMLAFATIAADIYFAILPWIFIWKLNLSSRERWTIAGSLSLGIFAAIAGAIRITNVRVCRPLTVRLLARYINPSLGKSGLGQQNGNNLFNGNSEPPLNLHTVGGSPMPGIQHTRSSSYLRPKRKWGRLPITTTLMSMTQSNELDGNSDEEQLTNELRVGTKPSKYNVAKVIEDSKSWVEYSLFKDNALADRPTGRIEGYFYKTNRIQFARLTIFHQWTFDNDNASGG
ncbi:hypothetical protein BX600DRAFT_496227 [Xylariales sp. PMI_506]|nr:hypothetical protein BX600DRAFT_496227 [Xylariales sp. PMI_506]